jgi:hypothetical protein
MTWGADRSSRQGWMRVPMQGGAVAPRGHSVWALRFHSRSPALKAPGEADPRHREGHSPNVVRITRATQGQTRFQLALLEDDALLFAPRIVFSFR